MKNPRKTRSDWTWTLIQDPGRCLIIVDADLGGMSVTNDAENVIAAAHEAFDLTNTPVIYRDSEGMYDQILHRNGEFVGFKALMEITADAAVSKVFKA